MAIPILVATPISGLGEFVQQTLEETGKYQVVLERSARAAVREAASRRFVLAVLDADLADMSLSALVGALQAGNAGLRFILLASGGADGGLPPGVSSVLSKPFYLPDLLEAVERGLAAGDAAVPAPVRVDAPAAQPGKPALPAGDNLSLFPGEDVSPSWLGDVGEAARHLMRLSLESAAQAALILHGNALWAYAGGLSQPAAQELALTVARHWANGSGSDLARFIRLGATGSEYMLYATSLGGNFVLALVFEAETPFSEIRVQAGSLARALAEPPAAPERKPPPSPYALPPEETLQTGGPPAGAATPALQSDNRWVASLPAEGAQPAPKENALPPQVEALPREAEAPARDSVPDESSRGGGVITLEPESPAVYHLEYACVLIPRLPGHYLTGDLAGRLSEWVGQLCLAFAWRLEYIAIRPDHLHWIVNVPPDTSPSYLMRILRQHTSQRIFTAFPHLAEENPSGDFWAPGYLIMNSSQPAPPQLIRDFIRQTRRHQGIA